MLGAEQTVTTFDKSGQIKTATTVTNANGTKSQQTNTVNGLKSMVTDERYDLSLLNGLKVTAQKKSILTSQQLLHPIQLTMRVSLVISVIRM
ncbi:hypothetical protein RYX41_12535 [Lactiplantibacillus plantarum]|nr:hypothetical protein [Lactiplantibacillus plantarum]